MGLTILTDFHESWMLGEVVCRVMLDDQVSVLCQQASVQDHIRQLIDLRQRIGWASENEGERRTRQGQESKHIHVPDLNRRLNAPFANSLLDKAATRRMEVHIGDILTTSGDAFETVIAGTAEQVQHPHLFEINPVLQDIVQGFLGKVRRWPCRPVVRRWFDPPTL